MSQDIGNLVVGSMLGHVESQARHHCCHPRGPYPGRSRRHLRRLQGLGLQADHPLPPRGRGPFEPRSRRPKSSPAALDPATVDLIEQLRAQLATTGLDAGPDTTAWHLEHHHGTLVSRSTISRYLSTAGLVTPEPRKRPKSSYLRFEAAMPNQTWQSDFTHYPLATGVDVEIISWLHDCTRYALHVSAHARITGHIVTATFPTIPRPARDPRLHADRQRDGLHDPPRRRHRRTQCLRERTQTQYLRERTQAPARSPEELPPQPSRPPAGRWGDFSRP